MIHERLVELLRNEYRDFLEDEPTFFYDGVVARFKKGVKLTIIYPREREYLLSWRYGEKEERIDTAPLHEGLGTYPNHYHTPDGDVRSDPLTDPERSPEENLRKVVDAILARGV